MTYVLEINEEDVKILDKALVQLPYGEVFKLINKINGQILNQISDKGQEIEDGIIEDSQGNKSKLLDVKKRKGCKQ